MAHLSQKARPIGGETDWGPSIKLKELKAAAGRNCCHTIACSQCLRPAVAKGWMASKRFPPSKPTISSAGKHELRFDQR